MRMLITRIRLKIALLWLELLGFWIALHYHEYCMLCEATQDLYDEVTPIEEYICASYKKILGKQARLQVKIHRLRKKLSNEIIAKARMGKLSSST